MQTEAPVRPDLDRPLVYRAPHYGNEGRTRLRVWWAQRVAVLTELEDNPGASITNATEDAWSAVCLVLDLSILHPAGWTLVEHYPANAHRTDTFDVVSFSGRDQNGRLAGASWCPAQLVEGLAWLRAAVRWSA